MSKSKSRSKSKSKSKSKKTLTNGYYEVLPKLESDYNESLYVFRNMMILYYNEEVIGNKQESSFAKKMRDHGIYRDEILNRNPYLYALYNKIPIDFFPYPHHFFYTYPVVTFYNSPTGKIYSYEPIRCTKAPYQVPKGVNIIDRWEFPDEFLEQGIELKAKFEEKWKDRLRKTKYTKRPLNREFQIHIPTKYMRDYLINHLERGDVICMYAKGMYLISHRYRITPDGIEVEECDMKTRQKSPYRRGHGYKIRYEDVEYLSVNKRLTRELFLRAFHLDTIEKGGYLYHRKVGTDQYASEEEFLRTRRFFTMHPYSEPNDPFELRPGLEQQTYVFRVKEAIPTLNGTYTILEKNRILGNEVGRENIDYTDRELKRRAMRDLYTCSGVEFEKNGEAMVRCGIDVYDERERMGDMEEYNYNMRRRLYELINKNITHVYAGSRYKLYLRKYGIGSVYNSTSMYHDDRGYHLIFTELHVYDDGLARRVEPVGMIGDSV
jgi:hypothetical protein